MIFKKTKKCEICEEEKDRLISTIKGAFFLEKFEGVCLKCLLMEEEQ